MAIQAGETTFYQAKRGIVQNGLILNLDAGVKDSYSGVGASWKDLKANRNGTLVNNPTFSKEAGGRIVFDGTDEYMDDITIPNTTNQLTVEFALNYNDGGYFNIFEASRNVRPMLWVDTAERLECSYSTAAGGFVSPGNYIDQDIIATVLFDGTATPGISLYVNGSLVGTKDTQHVTWSDGLDFTFFNRNTSGTRSLFYDGEVYFVRFYSRILSAAEVLQNYNATRHRFGV
tara:strand:+ start:901 stop:1593 length:693 start_codon:yes stop_codon:yes gene_type:complete